MNADFRLGDWIVRPQRRVIERGEKSVHIKPKPMAVLECLLAAGGEPVTRNELFDTVWPGGEVSDDTLTRCVVELRKAFGDTARDHQVIETIPKLGFRLVPPVTPLEQEPDVAGEPDAGNRRLRRPRDRLLWPVTLALLAGLLVLGTRQFLNNSLPSVAEVSGTAPAKDTTEAMPYLIEQRPGIAVLPFINMSSDRENDYFSVGMSEEILNALAKTTRVPVIARTSSFRFGGQAGDIMEIGRLLGVTHVLEGSVRKANGSVRVTAQLIDATTGMHVWSDAYQRELRDIFELQQELTKSIVAEVSTSMQGQLETGTGTVPGGEPMKSRRTDNLAAYEFYLRGMEKLASTNPAEVETAVGYFEQAIVLDEAYADAWAAKGRALYVRGRECYGHATIPANVYPEAIAAFRRALEIEPDHAFAMGWLGIALIHNDFELDEGMRLMEQSLALNPNDAALLSVYGFRLKAMKIEGADEVLDRAFRLDPFGIVSISIRAFSLLQNRRIQDGVVVMEARQDALNMMKTSLIRDRDGYAPNCYVAFLSVAAGQLDNAQVHLDKARLAANPEDLTLDALQAVIDSAREGTAVPWPTILERMQTERLSYLMLLGFFVDGENPEALVAAFDLGIEHRYGDLTAFLLSPRPPWIPAPDWRLMQQVTGVPLDRSASNDSPAPDPDLLQ